MDELKERFIRLARSFTVDSAIMQTLWDELERLYTAPERYYHNLTHLRHLFEYLEPYWEKIEDPTALSFAVFYHDAVYDVLKKDNEEQSAALAEKRLQTLPIPDICLSRIKNHILTTQKHEISQDSDTNFIIDADLAILGADWEDYQIFAHQIRQEYRIYPDLLYNPGRQKVLQHFLSMPAIYKTPEFRKQFEANARINLTRELKVLQNV